MNPKEVFEVIKPHLQIEPTATGRSISIYCNNEKFGKNQIVKFGKALILVAATHGQGKDITGLVQSPTNYATEIFSLAQEDYYDNREEDTGMYFSEPQTIALALNYQPYVDYKDPSKTLMYSLRTKGVSKMSYSSWKAVIKDNLVNLRKDKIPMKTLQRAVIYFDPHRSTEVKTITVEDEGEELEMPYINTYIAPEYLNTEVSEAKAKEYVETFKMYMRHLIPDDVDRVYSYYWAYHCLTAKMHCYLFLKGKQGTGKTDFAMILSSLVGDQNFTATKNNFLSTDFNSFLDSKQLAYADEVICKREEHREAFKKLTNDTVQIEGKGVDQKTVKSFCSFLISANHYSNIHIHPDDRRFSIIKCTDKKPDEVLGSKWYSQFRELKFNKEFLLAVRNFILSHNDHKYDTYNRLVNHEYEIAVVESANKTLRKIYDHFGLREKKSEETELYFKSVRKKLESYERRFLSSIESVKENLESFTWYGEKLFKVSYDHEMEDYLITRIK